MHVLDALLPEERARHLQRLALQLQEIEDHDRRRQEQQDQGNPRIDGELVADLQVLLDQQVDGAIGIEQRQDDEDEPRNREQKERDQRGREPGDGQEGK